MQATKVCYSTANYLSVFSFEFLQSCNIRKKQKLMHSITCDNNFNTSLLTCDNSCCKQNLNIAVSWVLFGFKMQHMTCSLSKYATFFIMSPKFALSTFRPRVSPMPGVFIIWSFNSLSVIVNLIGHTRIKLDFFLERASRIWNTKPVH